MRRSNHSPHHPGDVSEPETLHKDGTSILNHTSLALQLVSNVADGALNVPGLKPAAQVALQIVQVIKHVKANKQDCDVIANRTLDLIAAIASITAEEAEEDIDPRLKADLTRFENNLIKVQSIVVQLANRSGFSRVLNHVSDSEGISQCKEIIEHSHQLFQVHSAIALRHRMHKIESYLMKSGTSGKISTSPNPKPEDVVVVFGGELRHSQFSARSNHPVLYGGKIYPTADHLYQAFKFGSNAALAERMRTFSKKPRIVCDEAVRLKESMRSDWNQVCILKMEEALWYKFTQHADIRDDLLATGEAHIVHNSKNNFWGVGKDGNGNNHGGKALERVRRNIRHGLSSPYITHGTSP